MNNNLFIYAINNYDLNKKKYNISYKSNNYIL